MKPPFKRVAVLDGFGATADVGLYFEDRDGSIRSIDWPYHWPRAVSEKFLRQHGYEVRRI